ncbi:MAG: hypothetical protein WCA15_04055 [Candidatus Acidiferrales bacterium]
MPKTNVRKIAKLPRRNAVPTFAQKMRMAEHIISRYRSALRALANK